MNRSALALAGLLLLLGATTACSSDDETSSATTTSIAAPTGTLASSDGDTCSDPLGDINSTASQRSPAAPLSEPVGTDIVSASAVVESDQLQVTFDMAGPIATAPEASFIVAQGEPMRELSFEVRSTLSTTGTWQVELVTWPPGSDETRTPMALQPTVEGATFSLAVPLAQLPSIANYLAFGASSDVGAPLGIVFDECSSLVTSGSSTSSVPAVSTTVP